MNNECGGQNSFDLFFKKNTSLDLSGTWLLFLRFPPEHTQFLV